MNIFEQVSCRLLLVSCRKVYVSRHWTNSSQQERYNCWPLGCLLETSIFSRLCCSETSPRILSKLFSYSLMQFNQLWALLVQAGSSTRFLKGSRQWLPLCCWLIIHGSALSKIKKKSGPNTTWTQVQHSYDWIGLDLWEASSCESRANLQRTPDCGVGDARSCHHTLAPCPVDFRLTMDANAITWACIWGYSQQRFLWD